MIKNISRKIRLLSNFRKEPYLMFRKMLGFCPDNIDYYLLALRHSSIASAMEGGALLSNERLEFLGDAVLSSVTADILYKRYENEREGFLTSARSKVVSREQLNKIAVHIGLDKELIVTRSLLKQKNSSIHGNALEALIGAVYLDYGYGKCKTFIEKKLLTGQFDVGVTIENEVNFKSKLIEWGQRHHVEAQFLTEEESKPSSKKHLFRTSLLLQERKICEAAGRTKKESQQKAAKLAYEKINAEPDFLDRLLRK